MKILDFVPQFDNGVFEYHPLRPDGTVSVNPAYCLAPASAGALFGILRDMGLQPIGVVMLPPIEQFRGSPFRFNRPVPWFVFPKPEGSAENPGETVIRRNGGILASYWDMPGVVGAAGITAAVTQDVQMPVGV